MPLRTDASRSASVGAGMARLARSIAASFKMPVGLPSLSRTMTPPGTLGVLRSIPAAFSAALLSASIWRSSRCTATGVSGVTGSIQLRSGSSPPQSSASQLPPWTHWPGFRLRAASPTMRANSCGLFASRRLGWVRRSEPIRKWVWQSMKPGMTKAPARSTTRVALLLCALTAALPSAAIRPPAMPMAERAGAPCPVQTVALI